MCPAGTVWSIKKPRVPKASGWPVASLQASPSLLKQNQSYTSFCRGIPGSCPYAVGGLVGAALACFTCVVFWSCGRGSSLQVSLKGIDLFADRHPKVVNGK